MLRLLLNLMYAWSWSLGQTRLDIYISADGPTFWWPKSISTPPQTAIGASVFEAVWGGGGRNTYGGRRFPSRARQTAPQKLKSAHFIVDSAHFLKKIIIPAAARLLPEIAPMFSGKKYSHQININY
jgi:hypothetical protein